MKSGPTVAGAGPAGCSAALAALAEGWSVKIFEKSAFPRHKVCGEFLSPEIQPVLENLGAWTSFQTAQPSRIRSVRLHFGRREKSWRLATPAFGLSRSRLDHLLLECAISRGAVFSREAYSAGDESMILAKGRLGVAPRGERLFGFKAHFTGPFDDAVDLFFRGCAYAGVSSVEDGITNICGLAPESLLAEHAFDPERLIATWPALHRRVAPLSRTMEWLTTGPLLFGLDHGPTPENHYRAGDALGFADPFTGSGILSAMLTGRLAGVAAARGIPSSEHHRACARLLTFQYRMSALLRFVILRGWAEELAQWAPGELLFYVTRPHIAIK